MSFSGTVTGQSCIYRMDSERDNLLKSQFKNNNQS